jgi:hypothetical protein
MPYIPLNPDIQATVDKIKAQLITLAEDTVVAGKLSPEQAAYTVRGLTNSLNIEAQRALENLFSKLICPSLLFEQMLAEVHTRKKKYTLVQAVGCIKATLHDCGHLMDEEQKENFVKAVAKNTREDEILKGELE